MPFLTNDPLPQCLQNSSAITRLPPDSSEVRESRRHLLEGKCLINRMHRQIDFRFKANVVAIWRSSLAQLVPSGIFFDRNRGRSFESGKSLSKSHGNSLRANRGWFIITMFSRTCNLPGVLPLVLLTRLTH